MCHHWMARNRVCPKDPPLLSNTGQRSLKREGILCLSSFLILSRTVWLAAYAPHFTHSFGSQRPVRDHAEWRDDDRGMRQDGHNTNNLSVSERRRKESNGRLSFSHCLSPARETWEYEESRKLDRRRSRLSVSHDLSSVRETRQRAESRESGRRRKKRRHWV